MADNGWNWRPRLTDVIEAELNASVSRSQLSVGVGSMIVGEHADGSGAPCLDPGTGKNWNYQWTEPALRSFVSWLQSKDILNLDIYRCDMHELNTTTEPWDYEITSKFLKGEPVQPSRLVAKMDDAVADSSTQRVEVHVDTTRVVANTSDRLVSFTFDFHLCEIEHPGQPLSACNWHNASALNIDLPRLLPLAKALSPDKTALLRIGGGPAESVVYDVGPTPRPVLKRHFFGPLTHEGIGNFTSSCPTGPYCLTMQRWDELCSWAVQAGVRIVFGLNALSANMTRGHEGKAAVIAGAPWDTSNVRALLEYTKKQGWFERGAIYGFELGKYLVLGTSFAGRDDDKVASGCVCR